MFNWLIDIIFPLRGDEALVREVTLDAYLSRLEPQIEERTTPPTVALLPFADRVIRASLHEAKYHGNEKAFALLAAALTEYLRTDDRFDGLKNMVLVPLPLGRARRRERGFNQSEEVARRVSRELGVALAPSLIARTRETLSQVSLPRHERIKNMRSAFMAPYQPDPETTYLLLDDVITTGATLSAAIDALKRAGARNILPIALAH